MTHDVVQIVATVPHIGPRPKPATLPRGHWLLYGVARKHLVALAKTVPATATVDYWLALQRLDALHNPLVRPTAGPPPLVVERRVHYVTARIAIEVLAEFYLPNPESLAVLNVLDREWAKDPDHLGVIACPTTAGVGSA